MATKKSGKLSDLTPHEIQLTLKAVKTAKESANLDHRSFEYRELSKNYDNIAQKLTATTRVTFRNATYDSLERDGNIKRMALWLTRDKVEEIRSLGGKKSEPMGIPLGETMDRVRLIREKFSLNNEAGRRLIIDQILFHLVSNMDDEDTDVKIFAEYSLDYELLPSSTVAYGGVVDYLIVRGPKVMTEELLSPLTDASSILPNLEVNILEAKGILFLTNEKSQGVPQAAAAAAVYCKRHGFSTLRGCVTDGEVWVFFVYHDNRPSGGNHGDLMIMADMISLGQGPEDLTMLLGLIYDWIYNTHSLDFKFCTHLPPPIPMQVT